MKLNNKNKKEKRKNYEIYLHFFISGFIYYSIYNLI